MAEEFKLGPEEAVVLRVGKIGYGGGPSILSMFNNNELILTTKNLILLKKNMTVLLLWLAIRQSHLLDNISY